MDCSSTTLKVICIFILATTSIDGARYFSVELLKANFTVTNKAIVQSLHSHVYNRKVLYNDFIFNEDVPVFDVTVGVDMMKKDNHPSPIWNQTFSGCELLENSQKINLLVILRREIFRVSNLPKACPLLKNKWYTIKNYTIRDDDFPIVTPIMEWRLKGDFSIRQKSFIHVIAVGRIRKL
ncbi:uncharacterized protein LOC131997233 [Stomoxys calcitrans]|uniref:uncharacterized protein LOC131997233 n=1 Tax=Stomoxys calcitrans TaxID=35570 RepID=UPI0027E34EF6|nr:uncharacterized protein LOC131997233 [Stomoxys calcitrans]